MTKTAIFDAFGTVVRIGRRTNPYRQLLREGINQGRRPHPGDAHLIMTQNLALHELAELLGIRLSESRRVEIECALQAELTFDAHQVDVRRPDVQQFVEGNAFFQVIRCRRWKACWHLK
ncbi:hypothetical protein IRZ53_14445 [Pseudomonas fulva]|nr:hypothetical protein [Pseudomonas fulva]MBF8697989.1 hypothetical protein [Pseudomonas fulva]